MEIIENNWKVMLWLTFNFFLLYNLINYHNKLTE
jgi:hypothetical protein